MASTIHPPPFTSQIPQPAHDVFLSFRGEDTRYTFTGHLYAALTRRQVKTYIDNELQRGDEISPSLLKAISDAKLSVVVFSENYASSSWCLDELVKILECKKNNGQIFVPIFYHTDPTHVRNQTGSYAVAFAEHQKRNLSKVQTWRLALADAANFSGWDCTGTREHERQYLGEDPNLKFTYVLGRKYLIKILMEYELVEQIALDIFQKLDAITSGGIERRIATYRQTAQQKLEKSLRTGKLSDMEDLIITLEQLAELKLEKAMRSDDSTVWEDLMSTYVRIVQLKDDKWMRTFNLTDREDLEATRQHVLHIQREQSNRELGLFRGM